MAHKETKTMSLQQLVSEKGSVAEAARFLEMPYVSVYRWATGATKPDGAHVRLMALKGVRP